jgi:hypothetical protein
MSLADQMTRRSTALRLVCLGTAAAAVWTVQPVHAQSVGPALPNTALPRTDCEGDPTSRTDVVVCGRRRGESPFRLPTQFRNRPDEQGQSWSSNATNLRETERYENQMVGVGGASARSRETDCRWRAERQQLRGEQIDCSRSVRSPILD